MECQRLLCIVAQYIKNTRQFFAVGNLENQLTAGIILGYAVKADTEGLVKQAGQTEGELGIFRNNTHLAGGKGVAIEQYAVALGAAAAGTLHAQAAQFGFSLQGKGLHGCALLSYREISR